jgi:hypothetical protein
MLELDGGKMRSFLRNLALLAFLGIVVFLLFPDMMKGILGVYNGLGLLPVAIVLVILAALPRRKQRR